MKTISIKSIKRYISMVVAAVMCLSILVVSPTEKVYAATVVNTVPITCQVLGNKNVTTYVSINGKKSGYICPNDVCKIKNIYSSGWVQVEYPTNKGKKTAYAKSSDFFVNTNFSKTTVVTAKNTNVYYKANLSSKLGTTTTGDKVYRIGYSSGNQQILYPISGGGYKLGFVKGSLSVKGTSNNNASGNNASSTNSSLDSRVGKTLANINSKYYTWDNLSYATRKSLKGQCTWYGFGRFYELTGIKLKYAPDGKKWLTVNASDSRVKIVYGASNIAPKSIAVRTSGTWGHVMIIEDVTYLNGKPQYVYFTECNADGNGTYNSGVDCVLQRMTYQDFVNKKKPAGYIIAR